MEQKDWRKNYDKKVRQTFNLWLKRIFVTFIAGLNDRGERQSENTKAAGNCGNLHNIEVTRWDTRCITRHTSSMVTGLSGMVGQSAMYQDNIS